MAMTLFTNAFGGAFRQVAYVTNDLERALAHFDRNAGVKRFLQFRDLEVAIGPGVAARCHIALALSGGAEIEVIEPIGGADGVYRDGLSATDFALNFHHVAYTLPSLEALTSLKAALRARGAPIAMEAVTDNGLAYFYADLRKPFGHFVEYVFGTPAYEAAMAAALPVN
jgi:hypothetical protein